METFVFGAMTGFVIGAVLAGLCLYALVRGVFRAGKLIVMGMWATVGGTSGWIGRIIFGAGFAGAVAWHQVFDLNQNKWHDFQFLDEGILWFARKVLWPTVKKNLDEYPLAIATGFVWGAMSIGLDLAGVDLNRYPTFTAQPPAPAPQP